MKPQLGTLKVVHEQITALFARGSRPLTSCAKQHKPLICFYFEGKSFEIFGKSQRSELCVFLLSFKFF